MQRQRRVYCIIASNSSPCPIVQGSVVFVNVMSCLFCYVMNALVMICLSNALTPLRSFTCWRYPDLP